MRIATWNVNSLRARQERVAWWLERARPDVLLMQETKLSDADAPHAWFADLGYELAHHGQGRWNGVAIASRVGLDDVEVNFGEPERVASRVEADDKHPLAEARMISARCGGVRVASLYVPNGRRLDSPFYVAKLEWLAHLEAWLARTHAPTDALVLGGDYNVAPADRDVWDPRACSGGTHVSEPERAAIDRLLRWGLVDAYGARSADAVGRYSWWDYRAGDFHKNFGMRIDLLLVTEPVDRRVVFAEIDREARKGKPTPSDHTPVVIDLDEPGHPFDAGWAGADERIRARLAKLQARG